MPSCSVKYISLNNIPCYTCGVKRKFPTEGEKSTDSADKLMANAMLLVSTGVERSRMKGKKEMAEVLRVLRVSNPRRGLEPKSC
jgi:hypothetical protein